MGRKYQPGTYKRELDQWFAFVRRELEGNFTAGVLKQAGDDLLGGMTVYYVSRTYGIPLAWIDSVPRTVRLDCPDCGGVLVVDTDRTLDVSLVHLRCSVHGLVVHRPCVQDGVVHKQRRQRVKAGVRG